MLKIEGTHKYRKGNNYSPFLYDLGNMTVRLKGKHLYLIFAEYATVAKTGIKKIKSYFRNTISTGLHILYIYLFILIKYFCNF